MRSAEYVMAQADRKHPKKRKMSNPRIDITKYDAPTIINLLDTRIIGRNAERNRAIAKRHLIDGIGFEKLAEEFNLCDRQVKRIVYKCEDRIF